VSWAPQSHGRETADIDTSSDDYARRFAGEVGAWFLGVQARSTLDLLSHLSPNASIIDVGGGHAQVTPALVEAGYRVVTVGSHPSCGIRLRPWIARGSCRFAVADLQALPYDAAAFDAAVCFRLLPHSIDWTRLIRELCRVSRHSVIVDYPSIRSVNVLSDRLFSLKKRIEGNTRPFLLFHPEQIRAAFQKNRFIIAAERPQFLFPMVLHRWSNSARLGRILELPGRRLGLTRWLGSPVIIRADRELQEPG
jgi:SAM-dependent methyltransferase